MDVAPKSLISRASIGLYENVPTQPSSMSEHCAHWIDPQLSQAISLKRIADALDEANRLGSIIAGALAGDNDHLGVETQLSMIKIQLESRR